MNKSLLKSTAKLVVSKEDKIVYETTNIQELYLYPLTIIDYIHNLNKKKPIFLNIISIDVRKNYKKMLNSVIFNNLLCVEFLLDSNLSNEKLLKIKNIISYIKSRRIKLSLNIKNLNLIDDKFIKENIKFIDHIKCFYEHQSVNDYNIFLKKLDIINVHRKSDSLLHIKSYLCEKDVINYEKRIIDFKKHNVDVYQISKALLPLYKKNINFPNDKEKIIRKLEKTYNGFEDIKFISVKDLSVLFYPRFVLEERNCKKCSACFLKPYLYDEYILPCKVNKILKNMKQWGENNYINLDKFCDYGSNCDDCASIFENDLLGLIRDNYSNDNYKFDIICGDNND